MQTEGKTDPDRKSLLNLAEVSILLDSYEDIFSDFDPSEYKERVVSDDFIAQVRKFTRRKSAEKMSLKLMMPLAQRNELTEKVIIRRLHSHFRNAYQRAITDIRQTNLRAMILCIIGIVMIFIATYFSLLMPVKPHLHFIIALFEPGGWFFIWTGLDHLLFSSKDAKRDKSFYSKMMKSEISFIAY